MSTIYGHTNNWIHTVGDDFLAKALNKLLDQLKHVNDNGCVLTKVPGSIGGPTRFMVDGVHDLSRRWAWRIFCGPIPAGHRIYTTCGETDCVYPGHLMAYRAETPVRTPRQLVRPRAKLDWDQVKEIRQRGDMTVMEKADAYEVHPSTIRAIISGKTWVK